MGPQPVLCVRRERRQYDYNKQGTKGDPLDLPAQRAPDPQGVLQIPGHPHQLWVARGYSEPLVPAPHQPQMWACVLCLCDRGGGFFLLNYLFLLLARFCLDKFSFLFASALYICRLLTLGQTLQLFPTLCYLSVIWGLTSWFRTQEPTYFISFFSILYFTLQFLSNSFRVKIINTGHIVKSIMLLLVLPIPCLQ